MPVNPDRRIKLSLATQVVATDSVTQGYRVVITASDANLMANEVFKYYRYEILPAYEIPVDVFHNICTIIDIGSLPVDEPTSASNHYFRSAVLDKTYDNQDEATEAWAAVVEGVTRLKTAYDFNDGITTSTDYWIGTAP